LRQVGCCPHDGADPVSDESPETSAQDPTAATTPAGEPPEPSGATGRWLVSLATVAWCVWAAVKWLPRPAGDTPAAALVADAAVEAQTEADAQALQSAETPSAGPSGSGAGAPEGAVPEEELAPLLPDPAWAAKIKPPEVVHYTVRNGGTLARVANLFKIFHHEIQELNPGIALDKVLAPGTRVVVWKRREGRDSASIGYPSSGRLQHPVPMPEGPGRLLKMTPWKSWATVETVAVLDAVLREWAGRYPDALPLLVGNMSAPDGGRLQPHSTHQSGRDVDLGYPQKAGAEKEYNWRDMDARLLDAARTWDLLQLLQESGAVEAVFIDRELQKLLYEHAVTTKRFSKSQLLRWLEYPRGTGQGQPLVQHVPGHVDHLHVRVACPPGDTECRSRRVD
jgi:hypothetical protein